MREVRRRTVRFRPAHLPLPGHRVQDRPDGGRAHAARTAYYDAAALMLAGKPFKKQAAIAN